MSEKKNEKKGRKLREMRRFLDGGKLYARGLVRCVDPDADLPNRRILPDPVLVEGVLGPEHCVRPWAAGEEAELFQQLFQLTSALYAKGDALDDERRGWGDPEESCRRARRVDRLVAGLRAALAGHPEWKLSALFERGRLAHTRRERLVLLALIGRELGHLNGGSPLFTGGGLALAAGDSLRELGRGLSILTGRGRLARRGLIADAAGGDLPAAGDLSAVERTDYRLGPRAIEALGLRRRRERRGGSDFPVRAPAVTMDSLVLEERVQRALRMAVAQARGGAKPFRSWGLERIMPYGRAVTLLFAGPPGVGKTACAEALKMEAPPEEPRGRMGF